MPYEEYQVPIWKAGEIVPAGSYVRIDNHSYRLVMLEQDGPLPASFDGQVALYRAAAKMQTPIKSIQPTQTVALAKVITY